MSDFPAKLLDGYYRFRNGNFKQEKQRYETLARIYADLGLAEPQRWAEARLARLEREPARPPLP